MKIFSIKHTLLVALVALCTSTGFAQISKAEIRATGLTCSMCSNAINKQLKAMPETVNVETDLNTNTFTVTLKAGNALTPAAFKERIEKTGFFIGSLVLTVDAETATKSPYVLVKEIANKTKQVQIQVLDKGYVTDKEFKKATKTYKSIASFNNGNEGNFHVKVLN
jgi:copper chaperone CopZ